jgi:hypothetical protein
VRQLLRDKGSLTNLITTAHDSYLLFIDTKEDEMTELVNTESDSVFTGLHKDEAARNRARVLEITAFHAYELAELNLLDE